MESIKSNKKNSTPQTKSKIIFLEEEVKAKTVVREL
jgi:hypothetical protein